MAKKTFNIEQFKSQINNSLKNSTCSADVRNGMIFALETVLFGAGTYSGYGYLDQHEVPDNQLPDVRIGDDGRILSFESRFLNTDDTRRHYY